MQPPINKSLSLFLAVCFTAVFAVIVYHHSIYLLPIFLHLRALLAGSIPFLVTIVPAYLLLKRYRAFHKLEPMDRIIFVVLSAFLIAALIPIVLLTIATLSASILFLVCVLLIFISYPTYKKWILTADFNKAVESVHQQPLHLQLLFLISFGLAVFASLIPPLGYDAHEYHLAVPQQFLRHGYWIAFPYNVYAAFPMNVEMLYLYPLAFGSTAGCTVINLFMALFTGLVIARLAYQFGYRGSYLLPIILYLSTGIVLRLIVDAKNDLALAMCGILLLYGYEQLRREYSLMIIVMMSMALGFALGTKYITVLAIVFPFFMVVIFDALINQQWKRIQYAVMVCIGGGLLWLPWLLRNYILYHNPVYPLLTGVLNGTPEIYTALFSAAHASEIYKVQHGLKPTPPGGLWGSQLIEFVWLPIRKTILGNPDPSSNALPFGFCAYWMLFPFLFLQRVFFHSFAFRILIFALATYLIWFFTTQRNDRFLASLFSLFALIPCMVLPAINWDTMRKGLYILLLIVVGYTQLSQTIAFMREDTSGHVFFPSFEEEFYKEHLPHYRAIAWLNEEQKENNSVGTVLFIGEAQTFGAEFDHIAPTVFNPHPLQYRIGESVTHILYNAFELNRFERGYGPLGWPQGDMLRSWVENNKGDLLKEVYDALPEQPGNLVVFEIRK